MTLALVLTLLASADIVHLKNGGKMEGRVTEKGDAYVVENEYGSITIPKSDVERIEKKEWKPKVRPKMKPRVNLPESYSHPFYAFKIYLPEGWRRGESTGKAHCSFYGPKDVAYIPRMDLHIERKSVDLADHVRAYREAIKKAYPDADFPHQETSTIQGNLACQFGAVFRDGEVPLHTLWTFVVREGRIYMLSFTCTVAWYEKYAPRVDGSVRTLRIYREPAASKEQREKFTRLHTAGIDDYRNGRFPEALERFREAASLVPEYPEIHGLVGQSALRTGDVVAAEAAYRKAVQLDSEDGGHHYNLGLCLLHQSKTDEAIESLKKATLLQPEFEPALTNLGVAYLAGGKADRAKLVLEKALEVNPESVLAHFHLGLTLEKLGDRKGAEREFRETLKIDSSHAGAKDGLGRLKR